MRLQKENIKLQTAFLCGVILLMSCTSKPENNESANPTLSIVGTWKLLHSKTIEKGDTTFTDYTKNKKFIKILNDTHFSFLSHDLGQDTSASFVAGGGRYSLKGNHYTEHLEFCNYREWEGNTFEFELTLKGDTLIQQGIEKVEETDVERTITETYIKIKN